ncbi:MAG: acetyl-CoA C-acyltransferase [Acidimicrobiia bacterium]|nr:acetyl-CoA C-acyltransferase [Acidimicrobiia bacterium]
MTPVIVDAVRTPRGKAKPGGGLSGVSALEMVTQLLQALEQRTGIDSSEVDDVIIGCATQTGEQGGNLGKTAALMAGWDAGVPGVTINRFCTSGLDAIGMATAKVAAGMADVVVAGGVESVSRVPMYADEGPLYADPSVAAATGGGVFMGVAADLVATLEGFDRAELDAYGVQSHHRAARAWTEGRFDPSLVAVVDASGDVPLTTDEHVRPGSTVEEASQLDGAFAEIGASGQDAMLLARYPQLDEIRHVHHRGNSPSLADGAGAVLVMSDEKAEDLGLSARASVRATATTSVDPYLMLTAGQDAVVEAVGRAGLELEDVELVEFAEAFAALCLKFQRDLRIGPDRFNVNGGTIAMGHAFGASGAILTATLLDEMEYRNARVGAVGISGAAGLGSAAVLER